MKELAHELGHSLLSCLQDIDKRVNLTGLFLSFFMFYLLGYYVSTILIEIWSGVQIENLPAHCGWMILRIYLTGLSALFSYSMYLWMRDKKNPFSFPRKISWGGLFFGFFGFYLVGYIISIIIIEIWSGIQIEDLPAHCGWMMLRTGLVGLAALGARWVYLYFKNHPDD